jgi:hypothetical protein
MHIVIKNKLNDMRFIQVKDQKNKNSDLSSYE